MTIKPRTASLFIYQGDDLADLAELRKAAENATRSAKGSPLRAGDEIPGKAEKDAYDAAVADATTRAVEVQVQAIGRKRFAQIVKDHPPRTVAVEETDESGVTRTTQRPHEDDGDFGVNVDTFGEALLSFVDEDDSTIRTIVAPDYSKSRLRQFVDDELSEGDFRDLWVTAYYLNRAPSADPKASLYSTGSLRSAES